MTNILLLEDLPEASAWLKVQVAAGLPGAVIFEASRVHGALELIAMEQIDVALIDLGLPDGSGVDVVAALREAQPQGAGGGRHDPRRRRPPVSGAAGRRVRLPAEGPGRGE